MSVRQTRLAGHGTAAQSSESKLPRHGVRVAAGAGLLSVLPSSRAGSLLQGELTLLIPVARELAPAGLRSGPKNCVPGVSDKPGWLVMGLLRSPAGVNSLAQRFAWRQGQVCCLYYRHREQARSNRVN